MTPRTSYNLDMQFLDSSDGAFTKENEDIRAMTNGILVLAAHTDGCVKNFKLPLPGVQTHHKCGFTPKWWIHEGLALN